MNDIAVITDLKTNQLKTNLMKPSEIDTADLISSVNNCDNAYSNSDAVTSVVDLDLEDELSLIESELENAVSVEDTHTHPADKLADDAAVEAESILDVKADTSNSTTSSDKLRDPGKDLDTLLSKINVVDSISGVVKEQDALVEDDSLANVTITVNEGKMAIKETNDIEVLKSPKDHCMANQKSIGSMEKDKESALKSQEHSSGSSETKERGSSVEKKPSVEKDTHALVDIEMDTSVNKNGESLVKPEFKSSEGVPNKLSVEEIEDEPVETNAQKSTLESKEKSSLEKDIPTPKAKSIGDDSSTHNQETTEPNSTEMTADAKDDKIKGIDEDIVIDDCRHTPNDKRQQIENDSQSPVKESKMENVSPDSKIDDDLKIGDIEQPRNSVDEKEDDDDVILTSGQDIPILTVDDDDDDIEIGKSKSVEPTREAQNANSAKVSGKNDNDSDDDIVFYINKATTPDVAKLEPDDDDDVVLLDDDDEDHEIILSVSMAEEEYKIREVKAEAADSNKPAEDKETMSTSQIEEKHEEEGVKADAKDETTQQKQKNTDKVVADNTDNAQDVCAERVVALGDVDEKDLGVTTAAKAQDNDDVSSNCSSSSNLLQEAKTKGATADDEPCGVQDIDEEDEGDGDGDVDDVELIDDDADEKELAPPAKRIRLSVEIDETSKSASDRMETEISIIDRENETEISKANENDQTIASSAEATNVPDELLTEKKSGDDDNGVGGTIATAVKRSHDSLTIAGVKVEQSDETHATATKKPKTDDAAKASPTAAADVVTEATVSEATATEAEDKAGVKVVADAKVTHLLTDDENEAKIEIKRVPDVTAESFFRSEYKLVAAEVPIPLYPPPKFDTAAPPLRLDFLQRFGKALDQMTRADLCELVLQKIVEAIVHKSEFAEMRETLEKQEKMIASHRAKTADLAKRFRDLEMLHNRVVKDIEAKNSAVIMPVKITRAVGLQVYIPTKRMGEPIGPPALVQTAPSTVATAAASTSTSSASLLGSLPTRSASTSGSPPSYSIGGQGAPHVAQRSASLGANNTASGSGGARLPTLSPQSSPILPTPPIARRGCAQKVTPHRPDATAGQLPVYRAGSSNMSAHPPPKVLNKNVSSPGAGITMRVRYPNTTAMAPDQQQQAVSRQQAAANGVARKWGPKAAAAQKQQALGWRMHPTSGTDSGNYAAATPNQMPNSAVTISPAKPKEKTVIDLTDEDDANAQAHKRTTAPALGVRSGRVPMQSANSVAGGATTRAVPPLARMPSASQQQQSYSKSNQIAGSRQLSTQKNNNTIGTTANSSAAPTSITRIQLAAARAKYSHPAPLPATPPQPHNAAWKMLPPRPSIRISNMENGIVISWTMEESVERHAECVSYQIYAYQETSSPPTSESWRYVGDVDAMLLPMAVTLTQFQEGQRYYFAVRAVDVHQRCGAFSFPKTWT